LHGFSVAWLNALHGLRKQHLIAPSRACHADEVAQRDLSGFIDE
jgi:hypothetical protein